MPHVEFNILVDTAKFGGVLNSSFVLFSRIF